VEGNNAISTLIPFGKPRRYSKHILNLLIKSQS